MPRRTRWRVINRIKQHFRDASSIADVNTAAVYYARAVATLEKSRRPDERLMALHIKNLAHARRQDLKVRS